MGWKSRGKVERAAGEGRRAEGPFFYQFSLFFLVSALYHIPLYCSSFTTFILYHTFNLWSGRHIWFLSCDISQTILSDLESHFFFNWNWMHIVTEWVLSAFTVTLKICVILSSYMQFFFIPKQKFVNLILNIPHFCQNWNLWLNSSNWLIIKRAICSFLMTKNTLPILFFSFFSLFYFVCLYIFS